MALTNIKLTIRTEVIFNEEKTHRFLLRKEWDKTKEKAMIIMRNPSNADEITLDYTTMFIINNLHKLGFGSVDIVNIYSKVNSNSIVELEDDKKEQKENQNQIDKSSARADKIIIAWGMNTSSKKMEARKEITIKRLIKHLDKICQISDHRGRAGYHPLAPQIRQKWTLVPMEDAKEKTKKQSSTNQKEE